MKLSIAFGSGGARALASLGVISVLHKEGFRPSMVSGSSMGALIAAYYALNGEIDTLKEWYQNQTVKGYLSYTTKGNLRYSLIGVEKLEKLVRTFLKDKNFRNTKIPLKIISTNLRTGKVVFERGKLTEAVMASAALPGLMTPYKLKGDYYIDGGVVSMTPIEVLPNNHHRLGIDFSLTTPKNMKLPTMIETIQLASSIARRSISHNKLPKGVDIIIPCQNTPASTIRFDRAKEYIRLGEEAAEKLIRKWKRNGIYKKLLH